VKGICDVCRKRRTVHRNRRSGKAICPNCYRKDPSTHQKCFECGEVKPVKARNETGKAICNNCYQRSKVGKCTECKKTKVIQALGLCRACYQRQWRANLAARPA